MNNQNTLEPVEFFCPNCGEKVNYLVTLCPICNSVLSRVKVKLTRELIKGQNLTRIILSSTFILMLVSNILKVILTKHPTSSQDFIWLVLTALLFIFFYKGFNIARWLTIVFFGMGGVIGINLGISLLSKSWLALIPIVIGFVYVGFSVLFIKAKPVKYFQEYQRLKRKTNKEMTTFWMLII